MNIVFKTGNPELRSPGFPSLDYAFGSVIQSLHRISFSRAKPVKITNLFKEEIR